MADQTFVRQSPVRVRFKRCPLCGDIALLTSPVCSCCDRTFVTTARFTRRQFESTSVSSEFSNPLSPSPYVYSDQSDFVVLSQRANPTPLESKYNPLAIFAAAVGLGWLGMILNGQTLKGLSIAGLFVVWGVCAYLSASQSPVMLLFTTISGIGGYLVALTDVFCIASKLKNRLQVQPWEWF